MYRSNCLSPPGGALFQRRQGWLTEELSGEIFFLVYINRTYAQYNSAYLHTYFITEKIKLQERDFFIIIWTF
jgi:hypothetical protein